MTEKDLELEIIIRQANFTWERGEVALDEKGSRIKTREEYIATAIRTYIRQEKVKLLEVCEAELEMICQLCRVINPQHKDCNQCADTDDFRQSISRIEKGE